MCVCVTCCKGSSAGEPGCLYRCLMACGIRRQEEAQDTAAHLPCMNKHTHAHERTHTRTHIHTHAHTRTHTHTHTHTHAHAYTRTHTHTRYIKKCCALRDVVVDEVQYSPCLISNLFAFPHLSPFSFSFKDP